MEKDDRAVPATFTELDPEVARRAIEGYEDELSPEHKKLEALYRQHTRCPRGCGATMQKHFGGVEWSFSDPNYIIPRALMKCHHCGCVLNPFDGMIVELGKPDEANAGAPLIKSSGG